MVLSRVLLVISHHGGEIRDEGRRESTNKQATTWTTNTKHSAVLNIHISARASSCSSARLRARAAETQTLPIHHFSADFPPVSGLNTSTHAFIGRNQPLNPSCFPSLQYPRTSLTIRESILKKESALRSEWRVDSKALESNLWSTNRGFWAQGA